jgi:hypothetical protein
MRTGAALLGATALASAAYGLGTQSDGNAVARSGSSSSASDPRGPRPGDLSDLASRLGVSESRLRTALQELRPQRDRDKGRTQFVEALAKELGVTTSRLEDALEEAFGSDRARDGRRGDGRPGEGRTGDGRDGRPGEGRTGDGRHGPGHPGPRHDSAAFVRRLAAALDIEQDKVRAALDRVREAHEDEHEARHNAFADALAEKLGISKDKVREVLAEARPHGRGPR